MAETPKRPTPKKIVTAPDARTTTPPENKKRTMNDGPTGRARRAEDR